MKSIDGSNSGPPAFVVLHILLEERLQVLLHIEFHLQHSYQANVFVQGLNEGLLGDHLLFELDVELNQGPHQRVEIEVHNLAVQETGDQANCHNDEGLPLICILCIHLLGNVFKAALQLWAPHEVKLRIRAKVFAFVVNSFQIGNNSVVFQPCVGNGQHIR